MKGIIKSESQQGIYFVATVFMGIHLHASGTWSECKAYCKEHDIPIKIIGIW